MSSLLVILPVPITYVYWGFKITVFFVLGMFIGIIYTVLKNRELKGKNEN